MKGTHLRGNIYKLEESTVIGGAGVATPHEPTTDDTILWHLRLGHMSETGMLKLHARGLLPGVRSCKLEFCKYCLMGKQCRVTFKTAKHDTEGVIDYIHADVWGPVDVMSKGGIRYFLTFVDDFSKKVWVYFLKHKSEVFSCFKTWCIRVENQTGRKIKVLQTDNGTKFKNSDFDQFCAEGGIRRHFTVKKTPQQNGVGECMNRTIVERARCLRLNYGLSKEFWAEAVQMAVYLVNRSPNAALDGKVAEEVWTGKPVDYSILRIFGCPGYVLTPADERSKLDLTSIKCIFLGYSNEVKGYRLWDPKAQKIVFSRDVVFDKNHMLKPSNEQADHNSSGKKVSEKTWMEVENVQDPPNSTEGDVSVDWPPRILIVLRLGVSGEWLGRRLTLMIMLILLYSQEMENRHPPWRQ